MKALKFWFFFILIQGLAFADPCEEKAFSPPSSPSAFAKAMTEGLELRREQTNLFEFYKQNYYPYPKQVLDKHLPDTLNILEHYPKLSKPVLRERVLEFFVTEKQSPPSLKSFVRSFQNSAGKIRNNLYQIEANLGFYMHMLGWPDSSPLHSKPAEQTKKESALTYREFSNQNVQPTNKPDKKTLKQQQKKDFITYLDNTALNKSTRDFIQDNSFPYWERAVILYRALEEIRNLYRQNRNSVPSQVVQRIGQAMANLVHTVGFGNETQKAGLKSADPAQSYSALRDILNERDRLAFELGFEGHFQELKKVLGSKIPNETKILQQIHQDIQNQPQTIAGKEVLRLRALTLQESPFRGCLGGDCASRNYFEKALDPNYLYFTLTDSQHRSFGHVTVVLGEAIHLKSQKREIIFMDKIQNILPQWIKTMLKKIHPKDQKDHQDQKIKVGFVDKIQNVPPERLKAMLEGIRLIIKDKGYVLAIPKEVGSIHNGLTNESLIALYVKSEITPNLQSSFKNFKPHEHEYPDLFSNKGYSRAYDNLDLLAVEGLKGQGVKIREGDIHQPIRASPSFSIRSLYEPVLLLKDSRREEEQSLFLDNLLEVHKVEELGISDKLVKEHLDFVLQEKSFSFSVRKKAFFTLLEFWVTYPWRKNQLFGSDNINLIVLKEMINVFSKKEQQTLIGEMSNWKNTSDSDYRNKLIQKLILPISTISHVKYVLSSPFSRILDKKTILFHLITGHFDDIYNHSRRRHTVSYFLEESGVDVNAKNESGHTALMQAIEYDHFAIIKLLLDKGADVNAKSNVGNTALILAMQRRHMPTIQNNWVEIIKLLLSREADVNAKNEIGHTALMFAIGYGNSKIIELLLDRGADVNAKEDRGYTPLMLAIQHKLFNIIELLLDRGADVNAISEHGTTALLLANKYEEPKVVELLLNRGAK